MSAKKGIGRVAKLISFVGWAWFFLGILSAPFVISSDEFVLGNNEEIFFGALAMLGLLVIPQGLVWIIDGFTGSEKSNVLILGRWLDRK